MKLIFFYGLPLDATNKSSKDEFHKIPTEPYWELYDLKKDPKEMNNVYDNHEYIDIVKKLKDDLLKLKDETGDNDEKYPELIEVRKNYWN